MNKICVEFAIVSNYWKKYELFLHLGHQSTIINKSICYLFAYTFDQINYLIICICVSNLWNVN